MVPPVELVATAGLVALELGAGCVVVANELVLAAFVSVPIDPEGTLPVFSAEQAGNISKLARSARKEEVAKT